MIKNILFILQHPAHVHQFKYNILQLKKNNSVFVVAIEKDITLNILKNSGIDFELLSNSKNGILNKIFDIIPQLRILNSLITEKKIDLIVSRGNVAASLLCGVRKVKHIIFSDSEPVFIDRFLLKFASKIVTPSTYKYDLGKKHIRVNSYKELAYLHPNYFDPDYSVYDLLGLEQGDAFFIIRLVAWVANHDIARSGLSNSNVTKIIKLLEKKGRVFISSEKKLPPEFEKYRFSIDPLLMHSTLFFSRMLICDSQTMATEAALLGTPAIRINSFVGENDMGNFIELEKKYDLIYNFYCFEEGIKKLSELVDDVNLKGKWNIKKNRLLAEKTDMSLEMSNIINNELYN